jgi:Repeat of unknown function (DUF5907)
MPLKIMWKFNFKLPFGNSQIEKQSPETAFLPEGQPAADGNGTADITLRSLAGDVASDSPIPRLHSQVSSGITQLTGDVTAGPGTGPQAATIAARSVTSAKMAVGAAATNVGAVGGSLTGTLPNPTIASNAVSNAKLAQMSAYTLKGNNTSATANAADLTAAQATAMLSPMAGDLGAGGTKGLVPAERGCRGCRQVSASERGLDGASNRRHYPTHRRPVRRARRGFTGRDNCRWSGDVGEDGFRSRGNQCRGCRR